jgi:peroxiredoxin
MPNEDHDFPLPDGLPEPEDDGSADHLPGLKLPDVTLGATDGSEIALPELPDRTIVYAYPKTGRPGENVTPDGWEQIPGARGCTPESCGFRDSHADLLDAGSAAVFGLSLQSSDYQREARDRLGLPFEMLSDVGRELTNAADLPTFEAENETFLKRFTLVVTDGRVEHVFYPVFPPDEHATEVLRWLDGHPEC